MSECSKNHCCPFKIGQDEQCYLPVRDGEYAALGYCLITNPAPGHTIQFSLLFMPLAFQDTPLFKVTVSLHVFLHV